MDTHFGRRLSALFTVKRALQVTAILFVLALATGSLWAQGGTGALAGVVTDPQGAVVANAKMELTSSATGEKRSATSTSAGTYRFAPLEVGGTYTLTVEAAGFKTYKVTGIVVTVGAETTRNVSLQVGVATEVVNVEASAQLVQTTSASVSNLVDQLVWKELPLEDRNQNVFLALGAGVVPNAQAGSTRGPAVNGARGGTGNFLLEGFDDNDQGQGGRGAHGTGANTSGAITSVSPEAVQEYRVITNNFNPEYGKGGGFTNDTVLKSGTNSFHGSAFEYNRVQALAANDFFSNRAGLKDSLVRNQFGGSFGGPLIKDKTFFYASVEFHRLRQSAPTTTTGTTQQFLDFINSGAFETFMESDPNGICFVNNGAACPGAFANSATLGPIFTGMVASQGFPLSTDASTFSNLGASLLTDGIVYPVPVYGDVSVSDPFSVNENRFTVKADHKLTNKDQLTGTYVFQDFDSAFGFDGGYGAIGAALLNPSRSQLAGIAWTHTFSPTLVNQARFSFLRNRSDFPNFAGLEQAPSVVTAIDPLGVSFGNGSNLPQFFTENQFQWKDDLSWVKGRHTFKMGGEYRRTRNGSSFEAQKNGSFLPWGIEELATDMFFGDEADLALFGGPLFGSYLAQATVNPSIAPSGDSPIYYRGFRANEWAAYVQDEWKIRKNVTITLGVRWEYFGPPHNFRKGLDSNYFFGPGTTPIPNSATGAFFGGGTACGTAGNRCNPFYPAGNPNAAAVFNGAFVQKDHDIWNKDTNNFAPGVGFAWDVRSNGKLVIRGGYGIGYDRIWNNLFENIRFNAPFFSFNTVGSSQLGGPNPPTGAIFSPGLYANPFTDTQRALFNSPVFAAVPAPRHMDENIKTAYYERTSFGVQWEFMKDFALEVNYVGTFGHKLPLVIDINTYDGRTACPRKSTPYSLATACGAAAAIIPFDNVGASGFSSRRVTTSIAGDNFRSSRANSNYHALQATVRKRFSYGLQFNANYTYGHALDFISDAFNARVGLRPTDNARPRLDYGNADFDIRHRFVVSAYYELPFWKKNNILGGWSISGIASVQGGVPVGLFNGTSSGGGDTNKDGYTSDRPQYLGSGSLNNARTGNNPADGYFDTSLFQRYVCPATTNFGLWCNAPTGRGGMTGPGFRNFDFGVHKKFKISERVTLQYQANFFDIFNHANMRLPSGNLNSPNFGTSTATFGDDGGHRIIQMALRLDF